jgi:hypothetical protein
MTPAPPFPEKTGLLATPIRDLGLQIKGTPLEPVIAELREELRRAGLKKLHPDFYLSTEWGVPFGTISIAIPFYLARPDLTAVHAERVGHLEGVGRADLLRYLRHEMGHVVNYAYKLYEKQEWIEKFGSMTQPYIEDYRPQAFSRRFVRHLPGWYAQKHPDEDWAETFAVWLTPKQDWRRIYADWPVALAKLEYCQRTLAELGERDPDVSLAEADEAVGELVDSLEDFYRQANEGEEEALPPGLDGAIQSIFEDFGEAQAGSSSPRRPAADLIRKMEQDLMAHVYRWTGHFPERTRSLLRHLEERARQLEQVYPVDYETTVTVALTTLVVSLAMNHVIRGSYLP